ncbi:glycosyltransferase family 2 protein [Spirosoma utsteinense]|uniref:Glycosyltransferase involved in cell wall biosynthesis n=1 Tax=Spirosoma utsteinense TaxID=2585773 RepID=A0ABR6W8Z3_9BACT|nr:glycosyltransferase family 2 protein [Spirosoma utsteinense]MBC3793034.1 glycosyltransferase involved in cell wall biosynthesis [Spirosoma utsteinense]
MKPYPKITIITATYNAERYLEQSINGIYEQRYPNLEYIIVDGGSKDTTIDIVKKNSSKITYWISEPDSGIYDAWNKGINKSSGDWVMFLGSDDILLPGALHNYAEFINKLSSPVDYISSKMEMFDGNMNFIRVKGWRWEWPRFLREMTVAHPGSLHSRTLFEEHGKFDIGYKIVGDYEFLLRPGAKLKTAYLDAITVIMREGGASDSWAAIREQYRASTQTGKYSALHAAANMYYSGSKFYTKKYLRALGVNAYLRK